MALRNQHLYPGSYLLPERRNDNPRKVYFSLLVSQSVKRSLTPEVGCSLVVDHAGGQRAVVRLGGAEQDVVGQRLVQHGAVRAGVGRALAVTAHALVRQRPVQGAPRGRAARRRHLREGEQFVKREARETTPTTAGERAAGGGGVGEQQSGIDCRLGSREDVDGLSRAGEGLAEWAGQKPGRGQDLWRWGQRSLRRGSRVAEINVRKTRPSATIGDGKL